MRAERKYRRRRQTAAAAITAVLAGAVAAIVLSLGGSAGAPHAAAATGATNPPAHPTVRIVVHDGPHGTESVPILMYHVILAPPAGAPFPGLYVTPALFAEQMHALAAAGYHAVTMNQMWDNWHRGTPLPKGKPIVISFDNGYESQYRYALPVLRAMGWVGDENLQLSGLPVSQGGLSKQQVRGLVQALYHVHAEWFCYPSGHYDAAVIAAVKGAGFRGSTTVVAGWASPSEDPYRLPRLRVLADTSPASLLAEIAGIRDNTPPGPSYGL
jgi:hypothetical protein